MIQLQSLRSSSTRNMSTVQFGNGLKCPIIGFGTSKCESRDGYLAVKSAIQVGYRHLDCAHLYCNEKEIGEAIGDQIKEGTIERSDLFITGKLWNSFHRDVMVQPAVRRSLADLGLNYLDLYLIHWPTAFKDGWNMKLQGADGRVPYSDAKLTDTWKAMEYLVDEGLVKTIGVSNFNKNQMERILEVADIRPAVNQVECHPYLNQSKLLEFCNSETIVMTAYRAVGSSYSNSPYHDPLVQILSTKYGKTPAQILLKFQIQRGLIALIKSMNRERMISNLDVFDFRLEEEDMDALLKLDRGRAGRQVDIPYAKDHEEYPFRAEY